MVFAVNPGANGSSNSFANFQEEAEKIGQELIASASLASVASTAKPTQTTQAAASSASGYH
jgi:hypothetical protein